MYNLFGKFLCIRGKGTISGSDFAIIFSLSRQLVSKVLRIFCFLGTKLCTNILCYKIRILGVWRDVTGHARSYLDINNNNNSHKNSRSTTWTKRTLKARAGKGVFPKIKAMCCLRLARQGSNLVYTEPIASDTLHVLLLLRNRNSLLPLI